MPEVPLEHAHETIEHHAHGSSEPWVMGVALTAAFLAAFAAVTALYAEHKSMEAMLEQIQSSDKWAEFQANSIKEKIIETKVAVLQSQGKEIEKDDASKLKEYKEKKGEIKRDAEEFSKESHKHLEQHVPLSRGLTMFQVAIAVGAIAVLTKKREFWFVSLTFGLLGFGFFVWGFMA